MRYCLCLAGWVLLPVAAAAAPPTLDYLFPGGAQRGTAVEVSAGGKPAGGPVKVWVSGTGVEMAPARGPGRLTVRVSADAEPGVRWVRLYNDEGASGPRPFLVGTLPEVAEKGPGDRPQAVERLPVVVNGRLEKAGEVDVYAVDLRRGQTLVASLEANRTLRSPLDGVLQVLGPDGFVREQNNDFYGMDPHVVYPAPQDGKFLVRVFAFPAKPDASVRFAGGENLVYRLTLTTGGFIDYAYPLAVPPGKPGEVELIGWNIPAALRRLPVTPPGSAREMTVFHPDLAGTARVGVDPDAVAPQGKPGRLPLPATVSGRLLRPGAVDVYEIDAKKGQRLSVRAAAHSLGLPLDPVLRLRDGAGKVVAEAQAKDLVSDPTLAYAVAQDGPYRLEVRDLHGEGSERHAYRLTIGPERPDFALKLAADRLAVPAGKPLDVAVQVERAGGFSGPIDLTADGLPAGITAAVPPAEKTGKALVLRLTSDGTPFSGPVRIVGKSGTTTHPARATVAELGVATEHLWLTAGPAAKAVAPAKKKK